MRRILPSRKVRPSEGVLHIVLLNYFTVRSRWAAERSYPILRFFRNMLLKLRGRSKINNLSLPQNDRF